jgi:acetone carboxylase, beta subunit
MRSVMAQFETTYEKINRRVSRYGQAGISIMELGLIATADKVKPVLVKRALGTSDPSKAFKGTRETYIGGRWHKARLYEMDRLEPGVEVNGPAIVEHPATTLIIHPADRIFVDEWTLIHYRHA